jgi:hypothetical protein
VTTAFTPNLIGVGGTTALSVTITNPNSSGTLTGIGFADTLPSGLVVDNPNGTNGTCGSAGVLTAVSGTSSITLAGGSLKAGANCTVSVAVTSNQAEAVQNSTGLVSSSAGPSSHDATATLTVLAPPTVSVTSPRNHATYTYGQKVRASFSCGQSAYALGLADCSGQDDLGNDVANGGLIDTKDAGKRQLFISATSVTGLVTTPEVDYTVRPDNHFTLSHLTPKAHGVLAFTLGLPWAGTLSVVELAGKHVTFASATGKAHGKGSLKVTVKPTAAGRALLATLAKGQSVKVTLKVTYTPKGGTARSLSKGGIKLS